MPILNSLPDKKELIIGVKKTVLGILISAAVWFSIPDGYRIGIGPDGKNGPACLPYSYFLYNANYFPSRDNFLIYRSKSLEPYFKDGTLVGKILAGLPGDTIKVTDHVYVNGKDYGELNPIVLEKLGKPLSAFEREEIIPEGKYFVLGTLPRSLDSRYWGYIDKDQIIGKAYALW